MRALPRMRDAVLWQCGVVLIASGCFRGDYLNDLRTGTGETAGGTDATGSTGDAGSGPTSGTSGPTTPCGNGMMDPGEGCDDGNNLDADGCSGDCRPSHVDQVLAGNQHSCALFESGALRCWGDNSLGQIALPGQSDLGRSNDPCEAPAIDLGGAIRSVSTGLDHTCAVLEDKTLRCWGANDSGQLGYGDREPVGIDESPNDKGEVPIGNPVATVAAGWEHTCVVLDGNEGEVRCWGAGDKGQLGVAEPGDVLSAALARDVPLGGVATAVAAGSEHTCALLEGNEIRCWGQNDHGQLGYGHSRPVGMDGSPESEGDVPFGADVTTVSPGGDYTCAITSDDELFCWGRAESYRLGNGNDVDNVGDDADETPDAQDPVLTSVGGISAGSSHACAIKEGTIRCWGAGVDGRLGYGNADNVPLASEALPVSVNGTTPQHVAAGANHTCALLASDVVQCWGLGSHGRLGLGNQDSVGLDTLPSQVPAIKLWGDGCGR